LAVTELIWSVPSGAETFTVAPEAGPPDAPRGAFHVVFTTIMEVPPEATTVGVAIGLIASLFGAAGPKAVRLPVFPPPTGSDVTKRRL
jgi:hypothetical protein